MSFDPNLPQENTEIDAAQIRSQLNGLKALIDAIQQVGGVFMDDVTTLPPGSAATGSVNFQDSIIHFALGIPQGAQGEQGVQGEPGTPGPPGEVTTADLNNAITTALQLTSNNSNGVGTLGMTADGSYSQWQLQAVADKLDQLINALFRPPPGP